jgi:hypothetical protein
MGKPARVSLTAQTPRRRRAEDGTGYSRGSNGISFARIFAKLPDVAFVSDASNSGRWPRPSCVRMFFEGSRNYRKDLARSARPQSRIVRPQRSAGPRSATLATTPDFYRRDRCHRSVLCVRCPRAHPRARSIRNLPRCSVGCGLHHHRRQ